MTRYFLFGGVNSVYTVVMRSISYLASLAAMGGYVRLSSVHSLIRQQHSQPAAMSSRLNCLLIRCSLLLCVYVALSAQSIGSKPNPDHAVKQRQSAPAASPLVDFQVYEPVLTPSGNAENYGCVYEQLLMDHVFGFSYGMPFVGK